MYSCKPIINVIEILVPNESKKILARFSELLKKFIMFILGLVDDQDHILYINVQLIGKVVAVRFGRSRTNFNLS